MLILKRKTLFLLSAWTVLSCGHLGAVITGQEPVTVNLGSGTNVSYLAFDETSLSTVPIIYAWHYDGATNSSGDPWSGADLLNGVIADSASAPYALSCAPGAFGLMATFSIGASSSTIDPLSSPVWTYWIKGGSEYVPYGDNGDFTFNASPLSWVVSPANFDTRWLSNGSYDAWTLSPFSYSGAPSDTSYYTDVTGIFQPVTFGKYSGSTPLSIPEPSTFPLLVLAGGGLVLCLRWKFAKRA